MSAIGQKRTLAKRLKTPKEGRSRVSTTMVKQAVVSDLIQVISPGACLTSALMRLIYFWANSPYK